MMNARLYDGGTLSLKAHVMQALCPTVRKDLHAGQL